MAKGARAKGTMHGGGWVSKLAEAGSLQPFIEVPVHGPIRKKHFQNLSLTCQPDAGPKHSSR